MNVDIQAAVINLMAATVVTILGLATRKVTKYLDKKGVLDVVDKKQEQVKIAVNAIEQIATIEKVPDKFKAAEFMAIRLLNEQGIKITETELKAFIESAVAEMNKSAKDVLNEG